MFYTIRAFCLARDKMWETLKLRSLKQNNSMKQFPVIGRHNIKIKKAQTIFTNSELC